MKKVIRTLLHPSHNGGGSSPLSSPFSRKSKSKRRSSSTELQDDYLDGNNSFHGSDPLDMSHASLRSRFSFQLEDSTNSGLNLSPEDGNSSFTFVDLIPPEDHAIAANDTKAKPTATALHPITTKEDSDGTMDTTRSVDEDQDVVDHRSEFGVKRQNRMNEESWSSDFDVYDNVAPVSKRRNMDAIIESHLDASSGRLQTVREMSPSDTLAAIPTRSAFRSSTKRRGAVDKEVRFGQLEIYEHVVTVGGAVPSNGPSLTLHPDAQAFFEVSIDDYESHRPSIPRKGTQLLRSKTQRIELLLKLGYTMREINESTREAEKIRRDRVKSYRQSSLTSLLGLRTPFRTIRRSKSL